MSSLDWVFPGAQSPAALRSLVAQAPSGAQREAKRPGSLRMLRQGLAAFAAARFASARVARRKLAASQHAKFAGAFANSSHAAATSRLQVACQEIWSGPSRLNR